MELLLGTDRKTELTEFRNPFAKKKISNISIRIYNRPVFYNREDDPRYQGAEFNAKVEFKNGATEGTQQLVAESFSGIVEKINGFIKSLD
jgi:hypothetical protein